MAAPLLYGKYQLIDLIARGGMAEVYKAKSHGVEGFEKLVVIKRILPEFSRDAAFVDMFINEAKIAVGLSHANIVQVFDLGRSDDSYFIAMEYVHGIDLAELLTRARAKPIALPIELAVYLTSEVAKGLDYAHRRKDQDMNPLGIVHRDVSPQNVLVSFEGEVKITDFGIAWAMGVARERDQGVKGKALYMPPEQARGDVVDRRADIFALGVVLCEILSGRHPFKGMSEEEILELVKVGGFAPPPLAKLAPDVPAELCQIVDRAMSPDPDDRQPDAGRLYEELISFLYTTGRRGGAHDLSLILQQLREPDRAPRVMSEAERTLREAFIDRAQSTPGAVHRPEPTPVERPASAAQAAPAAEDGSGARTLPTELRDVTALAWTRIGEGAPPDAVAELTDLVEREGGVLVETGEHASVALFGLEHRDGRDTESAVACGFKLLRLAESHRAEGVEGFEIGLGVHTGMVVAVPSDPMPKSDTRYFDLVEEARALAARRTGALLISEDARQAVQDLFLLQPQGLGEWMVKGERPIGEVYGRFVGRRDELRRIGEQLAFSNRGAGSVLFIVGEPGTGKTRLLHETRKRLDAGGHEFTWLQVRCLPHLQQIPYASLSLMIRAVLGVGETDPPEKVREQIDRLRELGLGAEEIGAVATLLGVPDENEDRSSHLDREARVALLHIATKLAQDRLTVLVWDAAERMDKQTIGSLSALSHGATWARVLVLLTCTPPLGDEWNVVANSHVLELAPLSDEDTSKLAMSRLHAGELPQGLVWELTHKAVGNPLYIEEYVKALAASGAVRFDEGVVSYRPEVAAIDVPKSLRGLLGARIERLDTSLRGFLQRAAVLAPQFSPELLAAVAGTGLPEAQAAAEQLWREGIFEKTGRDEYAFVNDMLCDVVYDGITFTDRREIHRKVATEMERLYAGRLDDVAERLAVHCRESGQRERAVEYLCHAGDKLAAEHAHQPAFWHYLRAVELLQNLPECDHERVLEIYRRVGECAVAGGITDVAIEKMKLGIELAETVGDTSATVALLTLAGRLLDKDARFGEAQQYFSQALALSEELGDESVRRAVLGSIGETHSRNGEYKQATEYLEAALELARSEGDKRRETDYLRELGLCWAARGQKEAATECIEASARIAAELGDHLLKCEALKFRGLICYMVRDDEGALDAFTQALEMAKEFGFSYEIAANSHNVGDIQIRTGDYRAAFTALKLSHAVSRQHGFTKLETLNMMLLGFIDAVTFGSAEGLSRIERALEFAQDHGYTWDAIQATYFLGKACLELGDHARAREALREAIRMGRATDSRLYVEDCQRLLDSLEGSEQPPTP
jgi:predicted ATPase/tRNA A-37 threonylcarbamoyl transferase component Bud32